MRERPTIEQIALLAEEGRFGEADVLGARYLAAEPSEARGALMVAELALARAVPEPRRALEILSRAMPETLELEAWVEVDRGKAYLALGDYAKAEACWKRAIGVDRFQSEARRRLIDLYTIEGRVREARIVLLEQLGREQTARGGLPLLLRLARLEVDPADVWDVVHRLEPIVARDQADWHSLAAYGSALAQASQADEACGVLKRCVEGSSGEPGAWDAYLTGLELCGREAEMVKIWEEVPEVVKHDARMAKHWARVDQWAGRWRAAAERFEQAWAYEPGNAVGYRLRRALVMAGRTEDGARYDRIVGDYREGFKAMRGLFDRYGAEIGAEAEKGEFCGRMANACQRLLRLEDAAAWRVLASQASDGVGAGHRNPR